MKIKELLEGLEFRGYPCTYDCSGHQAGHLYATHWGLEPDECPYGNSNSFWEGCKSKGEEQEIEEDSASREFVSNKFYVKFTNDHMLIYKDGELVYKKPGDYKNITKQNVGMARAATSSLWNQFRQKPRHELEYSNMIFTPQHIHYMADKKGVSWDNNPKFMYLCKKLTGKRHLDDMDSDELAKVYSYLKKIKITENFADGRVKGKSRPGRVKRAGASCNGSVTDLRKRAKNASGERAKMYHWCANMKSGRKK